MVAVGWQLILYPWQSHCACRERSAFNFSKIFYSDLAVTAFRLQSPSCLCITSTNSNEDFAWWKSTGLVQLACGSHACFFFSEHCVFPLSGNCSLYVSLDFWNATPSSHYSPKRHFVNYGNGGSSASSKDILNHPDQTYFKKKIKFTAE